MIFFDTTVLVAASLESHAFHSQSVARVAHIAKDNAACGTHTLSELYVNLTRLQRPQRVVPLDALAVVRAFAARLKAVTLTADEHLKVMEAAAEKGLSGPILYDALLLGCARKIGAKKIYTLNPGHFRLVAPDLSTRILAP